MKDMLGAVMPIAEAVWGIGRIVLGSVVIFFLPGFTWSFVLYQAGRLDAVSRVAISIGLSVVMGPTALYLLSLLLGFDIDAASAIAVYLLIICGGLFMLWLCPKVRSRPR
jgi:uncharacterized membrane protein